MTDYSRQSDSKDKLPYIFRTNYIDLHVNIIHARIENFLFFFSI